MGQGDYSQARRESRHVRIWSWTWSWIWLGLFLFLAGCSDTPEPNGDGRLAVSVSIAPQAWLVEEIGGEHVDVSVLVKAGESPATFQPSDAEVSRVTRSKLYFRIGVPFENGPWFEALASSRGPRVVDARQGIELRSIEGHSHDDHDHGSESGDPHIWLSPPLLQIQARTIAVALTEQDPAHREEYAARLATLEERLAALDREDGRFSSSTRSGVISPTVTVCARSRSRSPAASPPTASSPSCKSTPGKKAPG